MKVLFVLILLAFIPNAVQSQTVSDKVVDCVVVYKVVDTFAIECKDEAKTSFGLKESDVPEYWRSKTQGNYRNADIPLLTNVLPKVGDVLGATFVDGEPLAVPTCDVRVWHQLRNWKNAHPGYGQPPIMLNSPMEICKAIRE